MTAHDPGRDPNGSRGDEFDLIDRYFRPLAKGAPAALGLTDDAAVLTPADGQDLIVATDMAVAGVHFLADTPPALVLRKVLRVNLSDLAAMGATPTGYLMAISLSPGTGEAWLEAATQGLAEDQRAFGASLLGGDTVAGEGPLTVSITVLGEAPAGTALTRSGAQEGDLVCISGAIGDAGAGLRLLTGDLRVEAGHDYLVARHQLPEPRLGLGRALRGLATAAIDVSDGLIADAGHLAEASGAGLRLNLDRVPVSPAAVAADIRLQDLVTSGDDYELLFTLPPDAAAELRGRLGPEDPPVTPIGEVTGGGGVQVIGPDGTPVSFQASGWRHR